MSRCYSSGLPSRPSDAGPAENPRDYFEWICEAQDELREALTERDNLAVQRKLRKEALDRARTAMAAAERELDR